MATHARPDIRRAIRNCGLRPSIRAALWILLANTDDDNGAVGASPPLDHQALRDITGWQSMPNYVRTLELAGWVVRSEDHRITITPTAEALAGQVVYRKPSPPSAAMRKRVKDRDGHACLSCGTKEDLTVDHVHPQRYGGKNRMENLRTLCRSCNSTKGDRFEVDDVEASTAVMDGSF